MLDWISIDSVQVVALATALCSYGAYCSLTCYASNWIKHNEMFCRRTTIAAIVNINITKRWILKNVWIKFMFLSNLFMSIVYFFFLFTLFFVHSSNSEWFIVCWASVLVERERKKNNAVAGFEGWHSDIHNKFVFLTIIFFHSAESSILLCTVVNGGTLLCVLISKPLLIEHEHILCLIRLCWPEIGLISTSHRQLCSMRGNCIPTQQLIGALTENI